MVLSCDVKELKFGLIHPQNNSILKCAVKCAFQWHKDISYSFG